MECSICGKSSDEKEILEGIFEEKIKYVCIDCAKVENIPLIRKPIFEEEKKENLTVRERMERMNHVTKPIPREHFIAHKNLARLKIPTKREDHRELVENYDWILKTGRRRKKLSQTQLAEEIIVPLQVIVDLESGKIAKDFEIYIDKIERFLDIRLRRQIPEKFDMLRKPESLEEEKMILESVKETMAGRVNNQKAPEISEDSNREKMKKWTLKDLINLKRRKKDNSFLQAEKSELVGDDLEL